MILVKKFTIGKSDRVVTQHMAMFATKCGLLCFSLIACRFFGQVLSEEICQVYQGDCRPREELEASRAWSWRVA